MLAYVISGSDEELKFEDVDKLVPELNVHRSFVNKLSDPRVLKTHELHNQRIHNAIYIVRDPRDVFVSYYHYLKKKLPKDWTISKFLQSEQGEPSKWSSHIKSWKQCPNVLIVKYEDLLNETNDILLLINQFLVEKGCELDLNNVKKAIECTSFEKLKAVEQRFGRNFLSKEDQVKSTRFFRSGIMGSWKQELSPSDIELIMNANKDYMRLYNYT